MALHKLLFATIAFAVLNIGIALSLFGASKVAVYGSAIVFGLYVFSGRGSPWQRLVELVAWPRVFFSKGQADARGVWELRGTTDVNVAAGGDNINVGYWDGITPNDQSAKQISTQQLYQLVGEAAGLVVPDGGRRLLDGLRGWGGKKVSGHRGAAQGAGEGGSSGSSDGDSTNSSSTRRSPREEDEASPDDRRPAAAAADDDDQKVAAVGHVLDVGCGFGNNAVFMMEEFAAAPASVTGLNISPSQLRVCNAEIDSRHLGDRVTFVEGSATDMPFEDNSFDTIVSVEATHNFPPRSSFARHAFRVLKPGGVLALCDLVFPPPQTLVDKAMMSICRVSLQVPPENVQTAADFIAEFTAVGFEVEEAHDITPLTMPQFSQFHEKAKTYFEDLRFNPLWVVPSYCFFHLPLEYHLLRLRKPL